MSTWDKIANIRYPITTLYPFYHNDGTRELLTVSNRKFMREKNGNLEVIGTLNSSEVKMLTYKNRFVGDVVLIADGGMLKHYNKTTLTNVTPHAPNTEEQTNPGLNDLNILSDFRAFVIKKDRIYAAAHPQQKNRINFSHFDPYLGGGAYDYFPSTHFIDVGAEENDEIQELKVFRDAIIVIMKRSIWALYGDGPNMQDYELVKINVPKGCVSPGSVREVGNSLFYLGEDHVYSLFSTERSYVSAKAVSDNVFPILKSISLADKEKSVSTFYENKYYLSFPSGLTLVYDIELESWTKFTNIKATSYLPLDGSLYFAANDGFVYRFNENKFADDGSPIPFLMKTKIIDFDRMVNRKKIKRMWVIGKQWGGYETSYDLFGMLDQYELIDLKLLRVNSEAGGIWDDSSWDDSLWDFSEVAQDEVKLRKKTKSIQLQVSNRKPDEPLTIYGFVFEYQLKKPK